MYNKNRITLDFTYKHEHSPVLTFSTPILRGMGGIEGPVGLEDKGHQHLKRKRGWQRTLTPQRNGETEVPTTESWLIAMISSFIKISRVSLVTMVSCKDWAGSHCHSIHITYICSLKNFCGNEHQTEQEHITGLTMRRGDFSRAHAVKCDLASANVRSAFPLISKYFVVSKLISKQ